MNTDEFCDELLSSFKFFARTALTAEAEDPQKTPISEEAVEIKVNKMIWYLAERLSRMT